MQAFTNTKESGFEQHITDYLVQQNQYVLRNHSQYNRQSCLDEDVLFQFLEITQAKAIEKLQAIHGSLYKQKIVQRLFNQIKTEGVIEVLRKGIIDNNIKLQLCYFKPVQSHNTSLINLYNANIFSVTRQVHFSPNNEKSLDIVIFINGIPIITFELKNELTKQTVTDAINQYKKDRSSKEELFRFGRCIVHFAVDTELVYMATQLKDDATYFLPFNKGSENNGAGNPVNDGIKTDYLWKEILTKSTLSNIIENYVQFFEVEEEKLNKEGNFDKVKVKKLIFPRFHQYDVVQKLLQDAQGNGTGQRYLVQHSAGSGKSNSISWLAHQLTRLHNTQGTQHIFDTAIVVTDRIVLDDQISKNIKQFEQVSGVVEHITDGGRHLKEALQDGKKIIITTIQKFPVIAKEIGDLQNSKFAIIIDEAHSSTSGSTLRQLNETLYKQLESETNEDEKTIEDENADSNDALLQLIAQTRKLLKNASYFAFTATPKNKTLELFGVPYIDGDKTKYKPFHLYSMKQAIEEKFIIDVLQSYTTYNSFYALYKKVEDDPQFDKTKAQKKLRKYVESHPTSIEKKTAIIINHFIENVLHKNKIKGLAKAMIVCSSRKNAVQYKIAFDNYLAQNNIPIKAIVAFSGEVDKQTESSFNKFSSSLIPNEFKKPINRFLIVANKYQTGFDQPLLHTMYVDKKLGGVNAVQTLSRLNRTTGGKDDTFVLDFANEGEEIKKSFDPFYETTILGDKTDPNKLFDLQKALDNFQIYTAEQVNEFTQKIISGKKLDELHYVLNRSVDNFKNSLNEEEQETFRQQCKSFVRLYVFIAQIMPFENAYLEKLYLFLNNLQNKLPKPKNQDLAQGILDTIDLDSLKYRLLKTETIYLQKGDELKPIPTDVGGKVAEPELDSLSNIVKAFNDRFGTEFMDEDKVRSISKNLIADISNDVKFKEAVEYTPSTAKITFEELFDKKFVDLIQHNFQFYQTINDNKEKKDFYMNMLFSIVQNDMSSFKRI